MWARNAEEPTNPVPVAVTTLFVVVVAATGFGCDKSSSEADNAPRLYHIADLAIETGGEETGWRPDDDRVGEWFSEAVEASQRDLSTREGDVRMRALVHHRTRLQKGSDENRMAVRVKARAIRNFVGNGDPMITFEAEATETSLLSEKYPSDLRLHHVSHKLGQEAVDRVVDKLKLRARLQRGGVPRLVAWIADDRTEPARRATAIEWAVERELDDDTVRNALEAAVDSDDHRVIRAACRGLVELEIDGAAHLVLERAQQLSRDQDYQAYLQLVPILGELDERWISIYLQTVAEAHEVPQIREKARSAIDDPLPDARF